MRDNICTSVSHSKFSGHLFLLSAVIYKKHDKIWGQFAFASPTPNYGWLVHRVPRDISTWWNPTSIEKCRFLSRQRSSITVVAAAVVWCRRWKSGSRTVGRNGRSRTPGWTSTHPPSALLRLSLLAHLHTDSWPRPLPPLNCSMASPDFIRSSTDRDPSVDCSPHHRPISPEQPTPSRTVSTSPRRRRTHTAPSSE